MILTLFLPRKAQSLSSLGLRIPIVCVYPTKLLIYNVTSCSSESPHGIKIFTGNSNRPLAKDIADHLGMTLGKITVSHFADGEVNVMVHENVRGKDVYIIQPTSPPVNETLMELLLLISTMRRASARKITAVIPYYGYARQDRKMQARVPISAADVARLLEAMGVDRVVAVDLHCGQIQVRFRLISLALSCDVYNSEICINLKFFIEKCNSNRMTVLVLCLPLR